MDGIRSRNKVVAQVTLAHIRQLAFMFGYPISEDYVLAFLNVDHVYGMWMRMVQAGEDFIKSNLPKVLSKRAARASNRPTRTADNFYLPIFEPAQSQNLT